MNQELLTLVNNAGAIFEQIKQMLAGEQSGNDQNKDGNGQAQQGQVQGVQMSVDKILKYLDEMSVNKNEDKDEDETIAGTKEMEDEKDLVKSLLKSLIKKASDTGGDAEAVNADDDAEERVDDQPPENEDAIKEVAKALAKLSEGKKVEVKKSRDEVLEKAIIKIAENQNVLQKGLENVIESLVNGFGIADQVKNYKVEKAMPSRQVPQDNTDVKKALDEIKKQLGISADAVTHPADKVGQDERFNIQKAFTEDNGAVLKAMFSTRNSVNK